MEIIFYVNLQDYSQSPCIRNVKEVMLAMIFLLFFLVASGEKMCIVL